jgi:hypothetical protein
MRRILVVAVAALCGLGPIAPRVLAADGPRVTANDVAYKFAESMTFTLGATSGAVIDDVVLHYTVGDDPVRNRRIPEFMPGQTITATDTEKVARGEIPPTTEIKYWWTITDQAGQVVETAPKTFRYLDTRFQWQHTDGQDVRIWWYNAPASFGEDLAQRARAALSVPSNNVGNPPGRPVDIVTYQSREDMLGALVDRGGVFESRLSTLGARVAPGILLLLAGPDNPELDNVLRHELTHIVLHLHLGKEYLSVPAWLDEGLAMYSEGDLGADDRARLAQAIAQDRLMSLRSLTSFPGEAELVPLAYAESRDVVAWLIDTYGLPKFHTLLDTLASGTEDPDGALQKIYGFDELAAYQSYRAARGLKPAATPAPNAARSTRQPPQRGPGPCGGAALLLPLVAALTWAGRRHRPSP